MAPKKMPKPETTGSIKSVLDQSYADAMENLMTGMKKAAAQGLFAPTDVERNFGLYKRAVRMLMAQGDNFIVNYFNKIDPETLTDPEVAKKFSTEVANKLGGFDAQKAMNFAPGIIEGHHGVSVDSIHAAAKHLPMKDRLEFIRVLNNEYGVGGTVGEDMYPLSRFAHQGKGTGSVVQKASAHTTANPLELAESKGFPVNTGTWSREFDFSNITNPRKLANVFMEQSGFPQMMMADKAFDSPQEKAIRQELADRLGIRERELYSLSKKSGAKGQRLQQLMTDKGVSKDEISEIVHRNYGLQYTPREGKLPSGPRIPKPKVTPTAADAAQFAKGWFDEADFSPTLMQKNPLVKGAKAISRAIPGPLDAALPAVVAGGVALASGATLPQAAQAAQSGAVEGLTGDLQGGDLANLQSYIVDGQQRFINQRNELVDQPGYGLQQRGGKWEVVKRGTGAATQQQRQATRAAMQQATKLIPQVNRVINPVGAAMGDLLFKPIGSAYNKIFGNRGV